MTTALDQVGPRLRAARRARAWTLDDLSRLAGVSASTLSRLESGKRQASLELLLPLTRALGIRIDDLLPAETVDPRVHRAVERRDGMVIAPLTLAHSPVQAVKIVYPARAGAPSPRVHDGYEWLYVLSGRVRLALDGAEHLIDPGEAAEFDTRLPHSISATADGPSEVLSIFSADGERFHTRVGDL
ncbi:helix-turn-helix domain-containing protein [Microbacterium dextranolyticum]|uniref:XRE family transcriptional regulator n=1 Tax=Microbacterium dextranolyticum TaxID=36806 RepID=A0A9W6HLR3_9MICO|nr:XRE family transcriptional regulator [Microbacterium dextranolyticum]MBM7464009.1 transcriptional regulator with XRE-family HTH domain [Microbacterium dextranolyticum]GLJ95089.1 XRE family transcriptional regulator [Microbacterium dextranolyticum]